MRSNRLCLHAISGPAGEAYRIGFAVFGVTAGLSGVCFAMAAAPGVNARLPGYAGEKFLHSSLLVVQTLLVVFIRQSAASSVAVAHPMWALIVRAATASILSLLVTATFWTWYHGFSTLNDALWGNWQKRIDELNEDKCRSAQTSSQTEGDQVESRKTNA